MYSIKQQNDILSNYERKNEENILEKKRQTIK